MKLSVRVFCVVISVVSIALAVPAQLVPQKLLSERRFFELRDELARQGKGGPPDLSFYRGITANRFNQLTDSVGFLQQYLQTGNKVHLKETYETLADDHIRLLEYGKAADEYKLLVDRFGTTAGGQLNSDYKNSQGLWEALRKAVPQTAAFAGDLKLQGTRDKANLLNLPVDVGGQKMDFVFDTGANLSTMTAGTAAKLKLTVIEADVAVGSTSDIKVKSRLAVVPEIKLGSVAFHNVVFLVLDDQALYFAQIDYQINGIIGFPMIEALGRLTISRTDVISASSAKGTDVGPPNMFLEDLNPVVRGRVAGKDMNFTLDSGAVTTNFYPLFFNANKQQILKNGTQRQTDLGGAGGSMTVTAWYLKDLKMEIGGRTASFGEAEILTDAVNDDTRNFAGNLGQDLIKQFASMTLDFRSMRLTFE